MPKSRARLRVGKSGELRGLKLKAGVLAAGKGKVVKVVRAKNFRVK